MKHGTPHYVLAKVLPWRMSAGVLATVLGLAIVSTAGCDSKPAKPKGAIGQTPAGGGGAPAQSSAELSAVLATVDDIAITVETFQNRLNRQSPYIRARYTSLEQKKEFLDSLVRFEVLAKEALRRGFDQDPEVVLTMKQVMITKLMKDEFETKLTPESIAEADIAAYYTANQAEYVKPEEVRASAIVLKNKAQADKVAALAQGEAGRTNKGFRDLVMKHSTDADGKLRGGDLKYFAQTNTEMPASIIAAAFALAQTGDVSGAIDAGNGTYWVIKQTGRRKAMTKTLDDSRGQIRNKLYRDRRVEAQDQFLANLKAAAKVQVNEDNLAKVWVDTSTPTTTDDGHGHMEANHPGLTLPLAPTAPNGQPTAPTQPVAPTTP